MSKKKNWKVPISMQTIVPQSDIPNNCSPPQKQKNKAPATHKSLANVSLLRWKARIRLRISLKIHCRRLKVTAKTFFSWSRSLYEEVKNKKKSPTSECIALDRGKISIKCKKIHASINVKTGFFFTSARADMKITITPLSCLWNLLFEVQETQPCATAP